MLFVKNLRKADHLRRFIIRSGAAGWEVRQEQDSQVIRQAWYQDWHRVERAQRALVIELQALEADGWQEV